MALPTSDNNVTVRKLASTLQSLWNNKIKPAVGDKADKVANATNGDFAGLDSNGNLTDSGKKASDFATSAQGDKADSAIQGVKLNGGTALTPDVNHVVDITKAGLGLDNVLNVEQIPASEKGVAGGVATLDNEGKVPSSQLPAYVDDVIEGYYYNSKFYRDSSHTEEITPSAGIIYLDLPNNKTYRWSGSQYTLIASDLALGETSSTAYQGDRGKIAYDHSQTAHARADATKTEASSTNGNIKINGTETKVYTHPTTTAVAAAAKKVGKDSSGHVVLGDALTPSDIGAAASSHEHTVSDITDFPTLGTAAGKNVAASGNASATEVVMGNDSRLTDARTPTTHMHGNIQNDGSLQSTAVAIATGDAVVVTDSSNGGKVAKTTTTFDGSTTTKALTQAGTFETFLQSHQDISGKANKSEMSVVAGTGDNADKTTITLKSGTSATVLTTHQDISGKADKSEMSVVAGTGDNADKTTITLKSGTSATVLTTHQDISGKADKSATVSNVAWDSTNKKLTKTINGTTSDVVTASTLKTAMSLNNVDNTSDANKPVSTATQTALDGKADLVSNATAGNFAGLDANGNLTDSGANLGSVATQSIAPNSPSSTSGKTYPIQKTSSGQLVVNVPWTNSTYTLAQMGQGYGTCATAEATAAKVVTLSNYELGVNGIVAVKFTYGLCANATLNINGKGAKPILIRGTAVTSTTALEVTAGLTALFIYDGTSYHYLGTDRNMAEMTDTEITDMINALT